MSRAGVITLAVAASACASHPPLVESSFGPGSESSAVALVESMIAVAGGSSAWSEAAEIGWLQITARDGMLVSVDEMVWDRVGDRFRHVHLDANGIVTIVTGHRSGRRGDAYRVMPSGCLLEFLRDERSRVIEASAALVREQSFWLGLPFTLRSREVRLHRAGERVEPTVIVRDGEAARYEVLGVERDGSDERIDIVVAPEARRPVLVERRRDGQLPAGIAIERWAPIGDIELATRRSDVRAATGERVPLAIPESPHYRQRVAIDRAFVPARGTAVLVSAIEVFRKVDESLFGPLPR